MYLSLIFDIFNKEDTIESLLTSWLDTLSGQNKVEVILIYDAPEDNSFTLAANLLKKRGVPGIHMSADDMFEVHCNQLGFQQSHGEWVIFAQDDNWMYDQGWDQTLVDTINRISDIGAIGFLGGSTFYDGGESWKRVEVDREHKGKHMGDSAIENMKLGVWECDMICRPFAISAKLLTDFRGLNLAFCPLEFDDADVCVKALKQGRRNVLIPFDLVNTCGRSTTIPQQRRAETWAKGRWRFLLYHQSYLARRPLAVPKMLYPLEIKDGGLRFV